MATIVSGDKRVIIAGSGTPSGDTIFADSPLDVTIDGDNSTVVGSSNSDTIFYKGTGPSIVSDAGDDLINASVAGYAIIDAGSGNDTIYLSMNSTITGGSGADVFVYKNDSGRDSPVTITDYSRVNEDDVIYIDGNTISSVTESGSNLVLTVGDSKITLTGAKGKVTHWRTTYAGSTVDSIKNDGSSSNIVGVSSNANIISSSGSKNTIQGAESYNNTVSASGSNLTIKGGEKDDSIISSGSNNTISAGAGNDAIYSSGANNTILGGTGNNTVTIGASNVYQYSLGTDVIYNYAETDTIQALEDINIEGITSSLSGDDVVLSVTEGSETGTITVKEGKGKVINILDAKGTLMTGLVYNGTEEKKINYYMKSDSTIEGTENADYIVISSGDNNTIDMGKGDDTVRIDHGKSDTGSVILHNPDYGDDVVIGFANVDQITSTDGFSLIGGSVSGSDVIIKMNDDFVTVKDGKSKTIRVNNGSAQSTFSNGKATLKGTDGADTFYYKAGSGAQVIDGYETTDEIRVASETTVKSISFKGNDVVMTIDSSTLTVKDAKDEKIQIIDGNRNALGAQKYGAASLDVVDADVGEDGTINTALNANVITIDASGGTATRSKSVYLIGNAKNNKIVGTDNVSSTLHGGTGNDTLEGGKAGDVFIYSAGKDVITNYQSSETDVINISTGEITTYAVSGNDVTFTIDSDKNKTLTVKNGKNQKISFINVKENGTIEADTVNSYVYRSPKEHIVVNDEVTVGGTAAQTISESATTVTLLDAALEYTGSNPLHLIGNAAADSIIASKNGDTLDGGGNKADTLKGGGGKDVFLYQYGNGSDVIVDYQPADDKIFFRTTDTTIASTSVNTKTGNVTFSITDSKGKNKSSLIVKDGRSKRITFENSDGIITSQAFGNATLSLQNSDLTVTSATGDETLNKIDSSFNSSAKVIDGSKLTSAVYITGNSNANSIIGGSKDDTLYAKTGKDTLTGGAGKDVFVFNKSDGTANYITDYTDGQDVIKVLDGAHTATATIKNSNDITMTIGKSKVRVVNGKGKKITVEDASGTRSTQTYGVTSISVGDGDADDKATVNTAANSYVVTVDASDRSASKPVYIVGNKKNNLILAGKDEETIATGAGKDTVQITPSNGKAVIITDYTAGSDRLVLKEGTSITGASTIAAGGTFADRTNSLVADTVVLTLQEGASTTSTLAVQGAIKTSKKGVKTNNKITIKDGNGVVYAQAFGGTEIAIANGDGDTVDARSNTNVVTINGKKRSKKVTIIGNNNANNITGGTKADTIYAGSKGGTINGAGGADLIYATDTTAAVSINGGAAADTIIAGAGKLNTLTGGAGKDIFYLMKPKAADDAIVITDYKAGDDKIQLEKGVTLDDTALIGNDVRLDFKDGSNKVEVTLKNTKDKKVTIIDGDGKTTSQAYSVPNIKVTNTDGDTLDASTTANNKIVEIDASKRGAKNPIYIKGNSLNNSIRGGAGADTIEAGSFEDSKKPKYHNSLTGGKGDDIFVYSGSTSSKARDLITDYSNTKGNSDKIQVKGSALSGYTVEGKDVILQFGSTDTTLTVLNGKDKAISFLNSSGAALDVSAIASGGVFNDYTQVVTTAKASLSEAKKGTIDSRVTLVDATKNKTAINIIGNDLASTLKGGAKNDTIQGGSNNDLITTGKGKDVVVLSGGTDTITDYTAGSDSISLGTNDIEEAGYNGTTLTLKGGGSTLHIQNAVKKGVNQKITTIINGVTTSQVYGTTSITVAAGDGDTIDLKRAINKNVTTVNASKRKTAVKIIGNDSNNDLRGGTGADTLVGGKATTSYTPGKGNDVLELGTSHTKANITYTGGNDVIYNFKSGDSITTTAKVKKGEKISDTEYKITLSTGTVDIKADDANVFTLTQSAKADKGHKKGGTGTDSGTTVYNWTVSHYVSVGSITNALYSTTTVTNSATYPTTKTTSYEERNFAEYDEIFADDVLTTSGGELSDILSTNANITADYDNLNDTNKLVKSNDLIPITQSNKK